MARPTTTWRRPVKPPVGAAEIDWSHPLARGLVSYFVLNEGAGRPIDLVIRQPATTPGTAPTWTMTGDGLALLYNTSTLESPYRAALDCLSGLTLISRFRYTGGQVIQGKPFAATHTSPFFDYLHFNDGAGNVSFRVGVVSNTVVTGLTANAGYTLITTADGVTHRAVLNGAVVFTTAESARPTNTNSRALRFGTNADGGEAFAGRIDGSAVYDRALTVGEAQWWTAEPSAMVRPGSRRRYFLPAGATTGSLDQTLAALTSAAAGTVDVAGAAAITLGALTSTAAGTLPVAGVAAITFAGLTSTAAGANAVAGVAAVTFAELAATSSGGVAVAGSLTRTLGALTLTAFDEAPPIGAGHRGPAGHRFIRGRGRPR